MRIGLISEVGVAVRAVSDDLRAAGHTTFQLFPQAGADLIGLRLEALLLSAHDGKAGAVALCRELRELGFPAAILILANGFDADHARSAFDAGCDDYFVEPFRADALLVRLSTLVLRRSMPAGGPTEVSLGPLSIDRYDSVVIGHSRFKIPGKELTLLRRLLESPDEIVTYDQLTTAGWGTHRLGSNALEVHVSRLRRWLTRTLGRGVFEIRSVRGVGYALSASGAARSVARNTLRS